MTRDQDHPTYANPSIIEALCRVEFTTSEGTTWQITRPTAFLQAVSDEYPNVEPGTQFGVAFGISAAGVAPTFIPEPPSLRVSNEEKVRYISVADKHFTLGHLARYPGWAVFRKHFLAGWQNLLPLASPRVVTKVGLRYINLIPRTAEHPLVSDWLSATETIPENLIKSRGEPFLLRLESWIDEKSLSMVTVGLSAPTLGNPAPILLDIDRTSMVETSPDPDHLMAHIDRLHDDVWREFASVRTPRLEALLNGKPS